MSSENSSFTLSEVDLSLEGGGTSLVSSTLEQTDECMTIFLCLDILNMYF